MPPSPHSTFTEIKIHTAKCDICNKHNALTMYRCVDCGQQCCTPCLIGKGGDGIHVLNAESTIIPAVKFVPTNKMKKKAQEPEQQAEQSDFIMADEDGKNDAWDEVAASERLKSDTKNNSALVEQFVPARSNTADKGRFEQTVAAARLLLHYAGSSTTTPAPDIAPSNLLNGVSTFLNSTNAGFDHTDRAPSEPRLSGSSTTSNAADKEKPLAKQDKWEYDPNKYPPYVSLAELRAQYMETVARQNELRAKMMTGMTAANGGIRQGNGGNPMASVPASTSAPAVEHGKQGSGNGKIDQCFKQKRPYTAVNDGESGGSAKRSVGNVGLVDSGEARMEQSLGKRKVDNAVENMDEGLYVEPGEDRPAKVVKPVREESDSDDDDDDDDDDSDIEFVSERKLNSEERQSRIEMDRDRVMKVSEAKKAKGSHRNRLLGKRNGLGKEKIPTKISGSVEVAKKGTAVRIKKRGGGLSKVPSGPKNVSRT